MLWTLLGGRYSQLSHLILFTRHCFPCFRVVSVDARRMLFEDVKGACERKPGLRGCKGVRLFIPQIDCSNYKSWKANLHLRSCVFCTGTCFWDVKGTSKKIWTSLPFDWPISEFLLIGILPQWSCRGSKQMSFCHGVRHGH